MLKFRTPTSAPLRAVSHIVRPKLLAQHRFLRANLVALQIAHQGGAP